MFVLALSASEHVDEIRGVFGAWPGGKHAGSQGCYGLKRVGKRFVLALPASDQVDAIRGVFGARPGGKHAGSQGGDAFRGAHAPHRRGPGRAALCPRCMDYEPGISRIEP